MVTAFVGSGGKTTLLHQYAEKYREQGLKVFVTTSTHMYIEEDTLVTDNAEEIIAKLNTDGYVMAGTLSHKDVKKIKALSDETYAQVCRYADVVLVEADGSKGMPIKFPNATEPVIYDNTDEIVVVCGLAAMGKKLKNVAFRTELVKECLGADDNTVITATHIQKLVTKGYLNPLKEKYPDKNITLHPVHDGTLYSKAVAQLIRDGEDVTVLKEEWFEARPKLVICGAGHVAYDLAKIASCLDFYIKVIDDRAEFANRERFPFADEVVCDSFDNLENHLEPNAFNVVVTRGHKADFDCVKKILSIPYKYIGMIGSKLKVKKTFENLAEADVSEELIKTIHAPIGLSIGAKTPAEIAISILAEIIQVKNEKQTATCSAELLSVKEKGVLCIITDKKGSSPRGVGSMMFVGNGFTVDSIGGGPVEFAAVKDARCCTKTITKRYDLSNEESEKLGMICGGENTVLFIPID
ncbi:MAG: putative selenium-dependent hydroxylase accessory protein YqeC [Oscillospiraceae bacterium]|nr:putative selenium-dependent hydroxylase accessory protein YqeC [Oscillospiraceae bacterium]